jgi:arylformamidase
MNRFNARLFASLVTGIVALAGALATRDAAAQHAGASGPEVTPAMQARRGVAALGKTWDAAAFAETVRLYTAVHRDIEWPGIREPEAFHYGPDAQQTLRLFRPEQEFSEPSLVFVFLHGNGLPGSDEIAPGSEGLIYSHLGKLGASFGGLGITANYRTGRRATARTGAEDVRLLLGWIQTHVAEYGGDVNTVVLLANSEGATNVATYLFDERAQLESGPGVAAAVLSSGLFGDAAPELPRLIERYRGQRVPIALWSAEYDPANVEIGIAELYAQLCRKYQGCPTLAQVRGHNHVSHVMSLGTADTQVQNLLIQFYHTVR